jgi:hypothetical protein
MSKGPESWLTSILIGAAVPALGVVLIVMARLYAWATDQDWTAASSAHSGTPWAPALNNVSFAAVIGAIVGSAGAVAAVFITDGIRARRKARQLIPALLRRQRTLARNRRVEIEQILADGLFMAPAPPPFSIDVLTRLAESVADHLNDREQQGLDNIAHLMRETESLANKANTFYGQSTQASPSSPLKMFVDLLNHTHTEAASHLSRLEKLIDAYLAGTLNEFGSLDASPTYPLKS